MSTTEPMTDWQIEERLLAIAPPPIPGTEATADGLARYLAVRAQLGWARNITPFVRDGQLVPTWQVMAQYAAAHALFALAEADRARADEVAAHIAGAWDDGGGVGEFLWDILTALGVDPREVSRLDEARLAAENAARAGGGR